MNTLIARKVGMTQIFDENSKALGVTVLDVSDCRVVQIKNNELDGYSAAQLTIGTKKNSTKPLQNHFKKYNSEPGEIVLEVEVDESFELDPGAVVKVSDVFEIGQKVDISGISKGKGFAGVMKRHNFSGQKLVTVFIKFIEQVVPLVMLHIQDMYLKVKKWLEEWEMKSQRFNQSPLLGSMKKKIIYW